MGTARQEFQAVAKEKKADFIKRMDAPDNENLLLCNDIFKLGDKVRVGHRQ